MAAFKLEKVEGDQKTRVQLCLQKLKFDGEIKNKIQKNFVATSLVAFKIEMF